MLLAKAALSELVDLLYEGAAEPEGWDTFLRQLSNSTHASAAAISLRDTGNPGRAISTRAVGLDLRELRKCREDGVQDIWAKRFFKLGPSGWVISSEELCRPDDPEVARFYDEIRRTNIRYGMVGTIERTGEAVVCISLFRPPRERAFSSSDAGLLNNLLPHMRRAFRLHQRIAEFRNQCFRLQEALHMTPTSIIALDAGEKVRFLNRAASDLLAQGDGLVVTRDRLSAKRAAESEKLTMLIREAIAVSGSSGLGPGGTVLISRKSRPSLRVSVAPARNFKLLLGEEAAAIAFIVDPVHRVRPSTEILREHFGLTPAESRLALLMADGQSLAAISEEIGVSLNTLKTQRSGIFAKTGVSRQCQLVRLFVQFPRDRNPASH